MGTLLSAPFEILPCVPSNETTPSLYDLHNLRLHFGDVGPAYISRPDIDTKEKSIQTFQIVFGWTINSDKVAAALERYLSTRTKHIARTLTGVGVSRNALQHTQAFTFSTIYLSHRSLNVSDGIATQALGEAYTELIENGFIEDVNLNQPYSSLFALQKGETPGQSLLTLASEVEFTYRAFVLGNSNGRARAEAMTRIITDHFKRLHEIFGN